MKFAGEKGFEPPTDGFEDRCSAVELFSQEGEVASVTGDGFEPSSTGNEPAELPLLHPAFTRKQNWNWRELDSN